MFFYLLAGAYDFLFRVFSVEEFAFVYAVFYYREGFSVVHGEMESQKGKGVPFGVMEDEGRIFGQTDFCDALADDGAGNGLEEAVGGCAAACQFF